MKKQNIYGLITIIAMITMPMAASINFGYAAYDALLDRVDTAVYLAIIGGLATGAGFEAIGILAGHLSVSYHGRKDDRYKLAALALIAYMIVGTWELVYVPFARFVPFLAGLVYLLAGLQYEAAETVAQETAVSKTKMSWQLEQDAKDRELERRMRAQQQADKTAVQLARIEAKTKAPQRVSQASSQTVSQKPAASGGKHYECVCGKVFQGSRSYNAHRRHCEIPATEPARIYTNGVSK